VAYVCDFERVPCLTHADEVCPVSKETKKRKNDGNISIGVPVLFYAAILRKS
jgi:hypothetical protein